MNFNLRWPIRLKYYQTVRLRDGCSCSVWKLCFNAWTRRPEAQCCQWLWFVVCVPVIYVFILAIVVVITRFPEMKVNIKICFSLLFPYAMFLHFKEQMVWLQFNTFFFGFLRYSIWGKKFVACIHTVFFSCIYTLT